MRVSVNIPAELLAKIDEKSKALYLSRSAYITTALVQKMKEDELISTLSDLKHEMKKLQDGSTLNG